MSFAVRGVIEGFYDRLWTSPERERFASEMGALGFTHYVYAPKEDRSRTPGGGARIPTRRDAASPPSRRPAGAYVERSATASRCGVMARRWTGRPTRASITNERLAADLRRFVEMLPPERP